jgi:hypothetical protein
MTVIQHPHLVQNAIKLGSAEPALVVIRSVSPHQQWLLFPQLAATINNQSQLHYGLQAQTTE